MHGHGFPSDSRLDWDEVTGHLEGLGIEEDVIRRLRSCVDIRGERVGFKDVVGMDSIRDPVRNSIRNPIRAPHLYKVSTRSSCSCIDTRVRGGMCHPQSVCMTTHCTYSDRGSGRPIRVSCSSACPATARRTLQRRWRARAGASSSTSRHRLS